MKHLVWYRNDLRIRDHLPLTKAVAAGTMAAVYCFDPRHFAITRYGFPKTGSIRARFLMESVSRLRESLNGNLIVRIGKPEEEIPQLAAEAGFGTIWYHREVTQEEILVEQDMKKAFEGEMVSVPGHTLYHPDDLPMRPRELPDVFTRFRKQVEKESRVRKPLPAPDRIEGPLPGIDYGDIPDLEELGLKPLAKDPRSVLPFEGGEEKAWERLNHYMFKSDSIRNYRQTRNGLLGADYSSKFSPWLANGSISAVSIYDQVERYEEEKVKNESTYWMKFELIWRDFFRFSAMKHGNALFHPGGIQGEIPQMKSDAELFRRWADGETGIPFVDANMRELKQTGFMSNRGRQNVASFLSQDLQVDWRMGAAWFESMLIDYDVASNWGNWAYNSTVGHDPRNRKFHVTGQAKRYDPKGEYVRHWIPELAMVPAEFIHEPWKMSPEQKTLFGVHIGREYPAPVQL